MRRAICPQPIKRLYFSNKKNEILELIINLVKKLSFLMKQEEFKLQIQRK